MKSLLAMVGLTLALAATPALADEMPHPSTADTQSMRSDSMNNDNVRKPGEFAAGDKQVEFLKKASSDQFGANKLIGLQVYDRQDKQVGEIDDLVLTRDGKIDAAVIGVGGFMGLGEKQVAVNYGALNTRPTGGNELKVTLNVTKEKLESAPAFTWSDQVSMNENGSMTQPVDGKEDPSRDTSKASSDQFGANKLIGLQVYDRQDKQVGEIDDLVLTRDGKIDAAVIGVGGFMGLDEKQVAVNYGALNTRPTGENELKVTLNFTKEKLESAPAFTWSDQVSMNENGSMTQPVDGKEDPSRDTASVIEKIKTATRPSAKSKMYWLILTTPG